MRNICGRHAGIYAGYRTRTMWLSYEGYSGYQTSICSGYHWGDIRGYDSGNSQWISYRNIHSGYHARVIIRDIYTGHHTRDIKCLSYGEYVMVIMWELQVVIVQEYGGYHIKPNWICIHHVYMSNAWI